MKPNIHYQTGEYWVLLVDGYYEVWKDNFIRPTRVAMIKSVYGLDVVIEHIERCIHREVRKRFV